MDTQRSCKKLIAIIIAAAMLFTAVYAEGLTVSDFAGSGESGVADGVLSEAKFSLPYGLAVDKGGSLLVADSYNNCIRRITGGRVETLTGVPEYKDSYGFPAGGYLDADLPQSRFNKPRDIAVDSKGVIYVSDTGNNVIRKIVDNKVYTFAGSGVAGFSDGSPARARFSGPSGLAVDAGDNLYVADSLNNAIRKITPDGQVTTLTGKPDQPVLFQDGALDEARFNEPSGLTVDGSGNLYVLDSGNQLIRKITKNRISTLCGAGDTRLEGTPYFEGGFRDGYGAIARFNFPKGITISPDGTLFVADTWNHRIRAIKASGEVITLAGTGTAGKQNGEAGESMFNGPAGLLYLNGKLIVADMWNNCLRSFDATPDMLAGMSSTGIPFDPPSRLPQIWVNKKKMVFGKDKPLLDRGTTYAPLDAICAAFGLVVRSSGPEKTVLAKGDMVKEYTSESGGLVSKDGAVYIRLRKLAEDMGAVIQWAPDYRAVVIDLE